MNGVTWAVLSVYALTLEGAAVLGLGEALKQHAPRGRLKNTARVTAQHLGALDTRGQLTPAGQRSARQAVTRLNLGRAVGDL